MHRPIADLDDFPETSSDNLKASCPSFHKITNQGAKFFISPKNSPSFSLDTVCNTVQGLCVISQ